MLKATVLTDYWELNRMVEFFIRNTKIVQRYVTRLQSI